MVVQDGEASREERRRRDIEAYTRAALNEVTARALALHESSGCWVRAITLDPQVWLLVSCRERAAMLAGGLGWVSGEREIVQN